MPTISLLETVSADERPVGCRDERGWFGIVGFEVETFKEVLGYSPFAGASWWNLEFVSTVAKDKSVPVGWIADKEDWLVPANAVAAGCVICEDLLDACDHGWLLW